MDKYETDGKSWQFQFDGDDKISYKYVLSITWVQIQYNYDTLPV